MWKNIFLLFAVFTADVSFSAFSLSVEIYQWPLLLTWINFNPRVDI